LYGLLCGKLPFNGDNNEEIINKICTKNYSYAPEIEYRLSPEVKDLIE
jgi:hypothetical protein